MTPHLLIFLGNVPQPNFGRLRGALAEVLERAELPSPALSMVELPAGRQFEGFFAAAVTDDEFSQKSTVLHLAPHLCAITRALARVHPGEVLTVFVHLEKLSAEACYSPPGGFARTIEGDPFEVLRQAATWMEAEAHALHSLFGAGPEIDPEEISSPDEEDLFVESRLEQARDWLIRYRRAPP